MTTKGWIEIYEAVKARPPEMRESAFRSAWLQAHADADSISFDVNTGIPHQAIYNYPPSTIAQEQWLQAFFAAVKAEMEKESKHDH